MLSVCSVPSAAPVPFRSVPSAALVPVPSVSSAASLLRFALSAALILVSASSATAQRADLGRARTLYNERQFDAAIEAAAVAQKTLSTADAATVVLARAHLE